eukprot:GEMP01064422.1.p1 GENE.GEMP01064422.1~~GEMP01064422.1.p1  ORF type:complete len:114 (+),score=17.95 GEMP01064422.1:158-499(+)
MVLHLVNCACAQVLKVVLFIVPLDLPKAELLAGADEGCAECYRCGAKTATYRGTRHHTTRQRSSYGGNPFLRAQDYEKPSPRVLRKRTWASRPSCPKGAARSLARQKSFSVLQ